MRFKGNAKSDLSSVFPEGEYYLTCTHVQTKDRDGNDMRSKKGNDMWLLEFTVHEGPHKDRKLWHYLVFIPEGAPGHGMPLKCLKAFGIDPEGENDILPEHLLNVTVKAKVKIDEGDGSFDPSNKVARWYTPDTLAKPQAISDAEEAAGTAQEDPPEEATSFDPKKLEKETATAGKPAPAAPSARKPLWGKK